MLIKVEKTLDESVCNFYLENKLIGDGVVECVDAKSMKKSPLAEAIFDLGNVQRVLIASDMVSVKKNANVLWDELSPQIMAEILDFVVLGAPITLLDNQENKENIIKKIMALVDARIRPALNKDGGDIEIKDFRSGILEVQLNGKCATCPYAMRTLKEGVEKILKNYIPQVKEVKPYKNE